MWILCLVLHLTDGFQFAIANSGQNNPEMSRMKIDDWPMHPNNENIEAFAGNFTNEFQGSINEKRNNIHLKHPCSCPSIETMKNFGDNAFPRYHISKVCDREKIAQSESVCKFGSTCKEFHHKIFLLKFKTPEFPNPEATYELPRKMRKDFFWDTEVSKLRFIVIVIVANTVIIFNRKLPLIVAAHIKKKKISKQPSSS